MHTHSPLRLHFFHFHHSPLPISHTYTHTHTHTVSCELIVPPSGKKRAGGLCHSAENKADDRGMYWARVPHRPTEPLREVTLEDVILLCSLWQPLAP